MSQVKLGWGILSAELRIPEIFCLSISGCLAVV